MPTLTIDNRTITVTDGTSVLEAAQQLGIVVPHFCYHRALGAVGACRMCAVHIATDKGAKLEMSCMVAAADGMVVSTGHPEAVEFRSHVGEWLMMNHPHDCPVCDEGGECQLQEMTIASGHSRRRFRGAKRTWQNQDLGPYVEQEMNRCIQCYRCVRTYRDYFGGRDFGVMGSRQRLFFGRFQPGPLESPFSGNLVEVCPTGVFTDKTFRFKSRSWDLQEAPSICPHCAAGCSVIPGARYRELLRIRAGRNEQVNGEFICDHGRFGDSGINAAERPRQPLLNGTACDWDKALKRLQLELNRLQTAHGKGAIAGLGSPHASLEANGLLRDLCAAYGAPSVFACRPQEDRRNRRVAERLGKRSRSLEQIRHSDLLVVCGCAPLNEAPLLASAIRQAARRGADIFLADTLPRDLTTDRPLPPLGEPLAILQQLGKATEASGALQPLLTALQSAERPILIGGAQLGDAGFDALLQAAERCSTSDRACGAHLALYAPNSFAAGLLANGDDFDALLTAIEAGQVKALLCLESDPLADADDPRRVAAALECLELLVVLDYRAGATLTRADIVLPTTAPFESAGIFINNEGRMQAFAPVLPPGEPLRQTAAGGHPPRDFSPDTPGALPLAATTLLARLLQRDPALAAIRRDLVAAEPRLAGIETLQPGDGGRLCSAPEGGDA